MTWVSTVTLSDFEIGAVYSMPSGEYYEIMPRRPTVPYLQVHRVLLAAGTRVVDGEAYFSVAFMGKFGNLCWSAQQWLERSRSVKQALWDKTHSKRCHNADGAVAQ